MTCSDLPAICRSPGAGAAPGAASGEILGVWLAAPHVPAGIARRGPCSFDKQRPEPVGSFTSCRASAQAVFDTDGSSSLGARPLGPALAIRVMSLRMDPSCRADLPRPLRRDREWALMQKGHKLGSSVPEDAKRGGAVRKTGKWPGPAPATASAAD